jgi:superfamily II RNA helicase
MSKLSEFLYIADTTKNCGRWPLASPAKEYSYELDNFQKYACAAIDAGENVLVTAKTGSGKTLVGEYQIAHSLRKGGRVFYTTPIKSLSNQKFHDLKQMFPSVGIMTGDIKFQPDAQVVIMTTEILRNLLYKRGTQTENLGISGQVKLDGLDAVIFDECHYINNKERGKVWEETMILLPREVSLVLLSATIAEPQWFASWLGDLKQKPIWLCGATHRVVPLTHNVMFASSEGGELGCLMDAKEVFNADVYKRWLSERSRMEKEKKAFALAVGAARDEREASRRTAYAPGELAAVKDEMASRGGVAGKPQDVAFSETLNRVTNQLSEKGLLPALFFCLSRKGCEQYAGQIRDSYLDTEASAGARKIFLYQLRQHTASLEKVPQYHQVLGLIERGVAFHHSGLLPVLKEVIEILFSRGFIKILFCTETFAVGINMPTKTAVFLGLKKYDDSTGGRRMLTTDEYLQMAGRAGRRGLDKQGVVIYLPDREPVTGEEMKVMMSSGMPSVNSQMDFGFDFILKSLHSGSDWLSLIKSSYWYRQVEGQLSGLMADWENAVKRAKEGWDAIGEQFQADLQERDQIEIALRGLFKGSKEYQKRLGQWQNKHMGRGWDEAWKKYLAWKKLEAAAEAARNDIDPIKEKLAGSEVVSARTALLRTWGFLNRSSHPRPEKDGVRSHEQTFDYSEADRDGRPWLTRKGLLATEVNEGNPLLMTELYLSGLLAPLSGEEIVGVLAAFITEGSDEENQGFYSLSDLQSPSSAARAALCFLDEKTCELQKDSDSLSVFDDAFWRLGLLWIDVAARWLGAPEIDAGGLAGAICQEFGLYEGNFVRGVLKLANLLEEMVALATLDQNVEMLEKLLPLQGRLVRGLVIPDSLYLRI